MSGAKEKEFAEAYWNDRASSFREQRKRELHSRKSEQWLGELRSKVNFTPGLRVLEVGCGAGFFSILLAKEGCKVTGIDLSPNMVEAAGQMANQEGVEVNFAVMDAEQLDFPGESFDVVVARNVTWNLPHPEKAYLSWLSVLVPGGILLNYDGEYAKDAAQQLADTTGAHAMVTKNQKEACQVMYDMVSISKESRPQWDISFWQQQGYDCAVDTQVGARIYRERDEFYIPTEIFSIMVHK